jgi:hypothetical protein
VFSSKDVDLAVFDTLTTKHMNIDGIHTGDRIVDVVNPMIAFRKKSLIDQEKI